MSQKTILCYGDSNTWGYVPTAQGGAFTRYKRNERWPGILQELLGKEYHVIEEGLNGRTTNLNYHIPPDRNGKTYLPSCLYSHAPIHLVVLALGGNDFKTYFNRSVDEVRDGLAELIDIIQSSQYGEQLEEAPKILLMSTPIPLPVAETLTDENGALFFNDIVRNVKLLCEQYEQLAKDKNCYYLDTSKEVLPSKIDGLHYDHIAHKRLASIVHEKIDAIFSSVEKNSEYIHHAR